jgi:hypothetical protein
MFWNAAEAYYLDENGVITPNSRLLALSEESVLASVGATDDFAARVADGSLTSLAWYNDMRQELKEEYIRQYLLGRGGLAQMTAEDWGSIGGSLAEQYRFLDGFRDAIEDGNLTEGQIKVRSLNGLAQATADFRFIARASMYVNSAREAFFRAQARARGFDPNDLPYQPCDGGTDCLTKCQCHWEFEPVYVDGVLIGYDCFWRVNASAQNCAGCLSRASESAPFQIRF